MSEKKIRFGTTDMFFFRWLMKIPQTEHVGNEEVLRKLETQKTLVFRIRKRQLKFLRHIITKEGIENLTPTRGK